jgi:hypothetical protein
MPHNSTNRGISILGLLFYGLILILALSYFNISIRGVVESETGQDNLNYVGDTSKTFWARYLAEPASYLWNDVWLDIFWRGFIDNMKRIRDGKPTELDRASPEAFDEANAPEWGR